MRQKESFFLISINSSRASLCGVGRLAVRRYRKYAMYCSVGEGAAVRRCSGSAFST